MGLYGMMRTSVSGMAAQANRLSTVADNIANSSTTGYKRASTEFSSLVLESGGSAYELGSVETRVRYRHQRAGHLQVHDLGHRSGGQGQRLLPRQQRQRPDLSDRAGSFVKDGDGDLVNAAGYRLMGYSLAPGAPTPVANGTAGLEVRQHRRARPAVRPVHGGQSLRQPAVQRRDRDRHPAVGQRSALPTYTAKTSLVTYDNLGNEVTLDVYMTKTADKTWEVAVYNQADADPTSRRISLCQRPAERGDTLTFDPTTGQLDSSQSDRRSTFRSRTAATVTLDMSQSSQLATDYTVLDAAVNGNAPSEVERVEIADDGTLYAVFQNGARVADLPHPARQRRQPRQSAAAGRQRVRSQRRFRRRAGRLCRAKAVSAPWCRARSSSRRSISPPS